MGKIVFVFLTVCLVSFFASSSAFVHGHGSHGHSGSVTYEAHHEPIHTVGHYETTDHVELYTTFANGIFDFFAKLIRAKVEVLLWLKRAIINLFVRGLASLRHLFIHNGGFVNGIIHTGAELLKLLLTSQPHFAIPHVGRIITEAEHEYIPQSHGHY